MKSGSMEVEMLIKREDMICSVQALVILVLRSEANTHCVSLQREDLGEVILEACVSSS